jgi:uncharacterized repeat protein (TIGR02543 family)
LIVMLGWCDESRNFFATGYDHQLHASGWSLTSIKPPKKGRSIVRKTLVSMGAVVVVTAGLIFGGATAAYATVVNFTDGVFTFSADSANVSAGATVIDSPAATGAVTIPATVTLGSVTYHVTTIGNDAFQNNLLTSVTIPNSVTTIGNFAFAFNLLASVTIPNSVTTIGSGAFRNNLLTSVTIPNSVTTIGNFAFAVNLLASVTIPNSVTTISDSAFNNNLLASVTIPNSVTTIGNDAFASNGLTSVTIPNSVTTIGNDAFAGNGLTSVTIPNSVTTIGTQAFFNNPLAWFFVPASVANAVVAPLCASNARTVTFDSAGGSALSRAIACSALAVPTPIAPTRTGFTFTGWSAQQSGGAPYVFTSPITANTTLFAQWSVVPVVAAPIAPGGLAATGASLPLAVPMGMAMLLLAAGGCVLLASRRRVGQRA